MKTILTFATLLTLLSCGTENKQEVSPKADSVILPIDTVIVDTIAVDSIAVDSVKAK